MQFIKSCGGVVFTRVDNNIQYVVVRHNGGHCGFPKGLMEPGEDERTTALREIKEEVGLSISILDGFRAVEEYSFPNKPGVTKQVVYFLTEFSGQDIHHQPEELTEAYLLPYEEALQMLTFAEAKDILTEADRFLHK